MWVWRSRSGSSGGTRAFHLSTFFFPTFSLKRHQFDFPPESRKRGRERATAREGGRGGPLRPPETTFATAAATDDDLCLQSREPSASGVRGGDRRGAQLSTRTRQREASEQTLKLGWWRDGERHRITEERHRITEEDVTVFVVFLCQMRQTWGSTSLWSSNPLLMYVYILSLEEPNFSY